ncbi:kinase-like domain-containing protein [Xylariaceae sp. FL1019]|nr:kinase-like domain-containing protein [Xylariaceae sp. FL1019]
MEENEATAALATSADSAPASHTTEISEIRTPSNQVHVADPSTLNATVDANAEQTDETDLPINTLSDDNVTGVSKSLASQDGDGGLVSHASTTIEELSNKEDQSFYQSSIDNGDDADVQTEVSDQPEPREPADEGTKGDDDDQLYHSNYIMGELGLENVQRYNKGGFHPVILGDVLDGRYQVVGKLGSGGFGTVWMCRELKLKHWRAVKIMTADHSTDPREMKIFDRLLETSTPEELEKSSIGAPLETFWVEGPNGKHLCLVTPIYGPSISDWRRRQDALDSELHSTLTAICRQVVQSLAFLHGKGICHGDFRPSNILMKIDQSALDEIDEETMDIMLGELETYPVYTLSGDDPDARAPDYLTVAGSSQWCKKFIVPEVIITDFGESFHSDTTRDATGIPISYSAPENTFVLGASLEVDLWALGCGLFEIVTGDPHPLFGISTLSGVTPEEDVIAQQEIMLGALPEPFRSEFDKFFTTMRPPDMECDPSELTATWTLEGLEWQRHEDTKDSEYDDILHVQIATHKPDRAPEVPRDYVIAVADTIYALLRWSPSERMSARNILQLDWLRGTESAPAAVNTESIPDVPLESIQTQDSEGPDLATLFSAGSNLSCWQFTKGMAIALVVLLLSGMMILMKGSILWTGSMTSYTTFVERDSVLTGAGQKVAVHCVCSVPNVFQEDWQDC